MIVLGCLTPARLDRLRAAINGPHPLHAAPDWQSAAHLVRDQAVDAIVVDPAFGSSDPDARPIMALRARFRSVPFVIYSSLDAATAPALATLGRAGFEDLILEGIDDESWRLREALESQPGVALSLQLLERLEPALRQAPVEVARVVERVIHTPAAFIGVPDLAAAVEVSRRTIYREFERAHLASPREVIAAARVLRAYAFLRESDRAIEDVAASLRFSSEHHLSRTMRWACGMSTARARERIEPGELIDRLVERVCPPAGDMSAAAP